MRRPNQFSLFCYRFLDDIHGVAPDILVLHVFLAPAYWIRTALEALQPAALHALTQFGLFDCGLSQGGKFTVAGCEVQVDSTAVPDSRTLK